MQVDDALAQTRLLRDRGDGGFRPGPSLATQRMVASMSCWRRSSGGAVRRAVLPGARWTQSGVKSHGGRALTASRRIAMNEWLFSRHGRGACFCGNLRPARSPAPGSQEGPTHDSQPRQIQCPLPKAITRLPLGVSSNFRYWGEDKTIYAASGKGARLTRHRRQRVHRLPPRLRPLHPRLRGPARG